MRKRPITALSVTYDLVSLICGLKIKDSNTIRSSEGSGSVAKFGDKGGIPSDGIKIGDPDIREFFQDVKVRVGMLIDEGRRLL